MFLTPTLATSSIAFRLAVFDTKCLSRRVALPLTVLTGATKNGLRWAWRFPPLFDQFASNPAVNPEAVKKQKNYCH